MTCLCVKTLINDLAGRLSTPRFFCLMLMDEARSASPLTSGKKIEVCLRGQLNRL